MHFNRQQSNKGVQSDSQNCHFLCGGAAQKPPFLPAVDAGVKFLGRL